MAEPAIATTTVKVLANCQSCAGQFRLDAKFGGKTIKCPKCKALMRVPTAAESATIAPVANAVPVAAESVSYNTGADDDEPSTPSSGGSATKGDAAKPNRGEVDKQPLRATTRKLQNTNVTKAVPSGSSGGSSGGAYAERRENTKRLTQGPQGPQGQMAGVGGNSRMMKPPLPTTKPVVPPAAVIAIAVGAILLVIVLVVMSLSSTPAKSNDVTASGTSGNDLRTGTGRAPNTDPTPPTEEQLKTEAAAFEREWAEAKDVITQRRTLMNWAERVKANAKLREGWESRFSTTAAEWRQQLEGRDLKESERSDGLARAGEWARRCGKTQLANDWFDECLKLDPTNRMALEGRGYRKFELPKTNEIDEMYNDSQLADLDPFLDKWLSPEEYEKTKTLYEQVVAQARAERAEWVRNPFLRKAHQAKWNLKKNSFFRTFEFDVFIAEPFVVLLTKGGTNKRSWESRKIQREAELKAVWREWRAIVETLGLKSKEPTDTLDNPAPFIWVNFATKEQWSGYQNVLEKATGRENNLPAGTRAYYDASKTRAVMFYEDENEGAFETNVMIHETIHQLMDRFTPHGVLQFRCHAFTEGYPEYLAGFSGQGESLKLGQFNQPARAKFISDFRAWFNSDLGLLNRPNKSDWQIFDAPLLLVLRDQYWVRVYCQQIFQSQVYGRSPYMTVPHCRAVISGPEGVNFHVLFYAQAWAFVYFLNEKYKDKYQKYLSRAMSKGDADTEVFLDAFGIRPVQGLPDMNEICGPGNIKLNNQNINRAFQILQQREQILRNTPAVQKMNEEFLVFLKEKFPPTPGQGQQVNPNSNPNNNPNDPNGQNPGQRVVLHPAVKAQLIQFARGTLQGNRQMQQAFAQLMANMRAANVDPNVINDALHEAGMHYDFANNRLSAR